MARLAKSSGYLGLGSSPKEDGNDCSTNVTVLIHAGGDLTCSFVVRVCTMISYVSALRFSVGNMITSPRPPTPHRTVGRYVVLEISFHPMQAEPGKNLVWPLVLTDPMNQLRYYAVSNNKICTFVDCEDISNSRLNQQYQLVLGLVVVMLHDVESVLDRTLQHHCRTSCRCLQTRVQCCLPAFTPFVPTLPNLSEYLKLYDYSLHTSLLL